MPAVAPPSRNDILIYAELLTNIRQVTIKASLPTPADHTTTAEILDEGRKFRISHNGTSGEVVLPATAPISSETGSRPGEAVSSREPATAMASVSDQAWLSNLLPSMWANLRQ
ncbi:hypothetical protein MY5147_008342 [Beauveria neobassiana]